MRHKSIVQIFNRQNICKSKYFIWGVRYLPNVPVLVWLFRPLIYVHLLLNWIFSLQEGLPVRLKGIHVLNTQSIVDKIMMLIKPFMKKELLSMVSTCRIICFRFRRTRLTYFGPLFLLNLKLVVTYIKLCSFAILEILLTKKHF